MSISMIKVSKVDSTDIDVDCSVKSAKVTFITFRLIVFCASCALDVQDLQS